MKTMVRKCLWVMAFAGSALCFAVSSRSVASVLSAPGTLDASFGDSGSIVLTEGGRIDAVRLQRDDKIVFADCCGAIRRLTRDGLRDESFGDSGKVMTPLGWIGQLVLQADGRIVVAGGSGYHVYDVMMRFHSDGTVDRSFGVNGKLAIPEFPTQYNQGWSSVLLAQANGRLVVARSVSDSRNQTTYLFGYNADGQVDIGFGRQGLVVVDGIGSVVGVAEQSGGKVIVAATNKNGSAAAARLEMDGSLDLGFGVNGFAVSREPHEAVVLAVQSDDRIVIAGVSWGNDPENDFVTGHVARFAPAGQLDTTFGDSGVVTIRFRVDWGPAFDGSLPIHSLVLQSDGKLLVGGELSEIDGSVNSWIGRYDSSGALDATFGDSGYTFGFFNDDLLLQRDGRILVKGGPLNRFRGDEVHEFHNATLGHYFMTSNPLEQDSILAGGSGPGWITTGQSFKSNGTARACRFAGTPGIGPRSHVFAIDPGECEIVKLDPGWKFEGLDFSASPVDAAGSCGPGYLPVYRVYNNRFEQNDSGQRYLTDRAIYETMKTAGWIGEGVAFCAPQ